MWKQWLVVFIGGGMGSILRLAFQKLTISFNSTFPWATFSANLFGCFLFGILTGYFTHHGHLKSDTALFFLVGFCGGLTTFSSFINEGQQILHQNLFLNFVIYNGLSIGLGLCLIYIGYSFWK